ncbi:MAG: thermonuclease family protein [Cyclobacteriaceae bacterium]|nr:thermonuclease family protein [Cyclobacteriaceae bacterium]
MIWMVGTPILKANDVFSVRVVTVLDGNTLEVRGSDNEIKKIVLAEIDSPELGQAFGDKAKKFLEKLLLEKNVWVRITGKDRRGNYLAIVMIGDKVDARVELLKEGLAWTAERNPNPELESYRMKAQEKGRGLWKEDNQTPPWVYRREQSMLEAKGS